MRHKRTRKLRPQHKSMVALPCVLSMALDDGQQRRMQGRSTSLQRRCCLFDDDQHTERGNKCQHAQVYDGANAHWMATNIHRGATNASTDKCAQNQSTRLLPCAGTEGRRAARCEGGSSRMQEHQQEGIKHLQHNTEQSYWGPS